MNIRYRRLKTLLATVCIVLAGCGYSTSSLLREDIRTIYVPVFDNQTWYRGLETDLTEAIVEEIKTHTLLKFAPPQQADSTLEGELIAFEKDIASKTKDDQILIMRVTAKVRFRWTDNLTRTDIVATRTVQENILVVVALGEAAEKRLFCKMAQRIVETMQKPW